MMTRPARPVASPSALLSLGALMVLCALCAPATSEAEPYRSQYVADLPFVHLATTTITHDSRTLQYSLNIQRESDAPVGNLARAYDPAWVEARLETIWSLMDAYMDYRDLPNADCRVGFNVNLFVIARAQMAERARFLEFKRRSDMLDYVIFAMYDSTPEVIGDSAIILSALDDAPSNSDLVREVAQYWYDQDRGQR